MIPHVYDDGSDAECQSSYQGIDTMPAFDTDWPADSTEFCPHPSALDIFVCGTYKLEQSQTNEVASDAQDDKVREEDEGSTQTRQQQTRRGKCLLFRVQDDDQLYVRSCTDAKIKSCAEIHQISDLLHETELPAILDMKWSLAREKK